MAQAKLLEVFLTAVRGVHSTSGGTKETSYYTALNNLLDGVGNTLMNRPGFELTPRSWTNFKGIYGEVRISIQAQGRQELLGR